MSTSILMKGYHFWNISIRLLRELILTSSLLIAYSSWHTCCSLLVFLQDESSMKITSNKPPARRSFPADGLNGRWRRVTSSISLHEKHWGFCSHWVYILFYKLRVLSNDSIVSACRKTYRWKTPGMPCAIVILHIIIRSKNLYTLL